MKLINETLIASPESLGADYTSTPIYLGNIVNYSIQLVFTGSPVGTFKLQCSNDLGNTMQPGKTPTTGNLTNWTDIASSSQAISAAGNHTWDVQNCGYLWVRVVYTRTSGSGSLTTARFTAKGA